MKLAITLNLQDAKGAENLESMVDVYIKVDIPVICKMMEFLQGSNIKELSCIMFLYRTIKVEPPGMPQMMMKNASNELLLQHGIKKRLENILRESACYSITEKQYN